MKRYYPFITLILLVLPTVACGLLSPRHRYSNEIRLAVFEYNREKHGPVDDLVIDFERGEPRVKFEGQNENGGHTVWLYPAGAEEYFATRPTEETYLYIQDIAYSGGQNSATVTLYQGDGHNYQGRQLTLVKDQQNRWNVTEDTKIDNG